MPVHEDLGIRMKEFYEKIPQTKLMRRTPVAIRIDGKVFHTFTRGFEKPFDKVLMKSMHSRIILDQIQVRLLPISLRKSLLTFLRLTKQSTNSK